MKFGKELAYAYILTHEDQQFFFTVIMKRSNKTKLNNLNGFTTTKQTGNTSFYTQIMTRIQQEENGYNGNPGLVVYINNSSTWQER
jgi:alpha-amylase